MTKVLERKSLYFSSKGFRSKNQIGLFIPDAFFRVPSSSQYLGMYIKKCNIPNDFLSVSVHNDEFDWNGETFHLPNEYPDIYDVMNDLGVSLVLQSADC